MSPPRRSFLRRRHVATAAMLLLAAGGCAAVPLATAGTLLGIAATGVSTGSDLYSNGKLDSVHLADRDALTAATRAAAADLGLALQELSSHDGNTLRLIFRDDRGAEIKVTTQPRTAKLSRTRIDVGTFGSEVTARLLLRRIRVHLPDGGLGPPPADSSRPARAARAS